MWSVHLIHRLLSLMLCNCYYGVSNGFLGDHVDKGMVQPSDSTGLGTGRSSYLVSHRHGKVVENGLDGAEGLVVSDRRGAEGRMTAEKMLNIFQEHIDVEDGEDGCQLPGYTPQALLGRRGRKTHSIRTHTHTQAELTFMAISDHLVAKPSELRLSNITRSSDLHTHTHHHIHHGNGSFSIPKTENQTSSF